MFCVIFFFQAEDGIRDLVRSRGLGDVYKRQIEASRPNPAIDFVDEDILHRIVISEAIKAYHTKQLSLIHI